MSDGALSIASQAVVGTSATAGDIRIAETYSSDQSSQVELTPTQLSGGQWVGPAVRARNGGQDTYLGIYFWNNGSPQLRLYKRNAGTWTQLGSSYASGPLPAGTKLQVSAVGSTITFLQDGVARIVATDSSITGGAPGVMTYGQATADNWSGGNGTRTPAATRSAAPSPGSTGRVVLQDNGGDDLTLTANGAFTFATKLAAGRAYSVTVETSPSGQTCSAANSSGTIDSADVTDVAVTCTSEACGQQGRRRLQSGRRRAWVGLGRDQRRRLSIAAQPVVGTSGNRRRHPHRRDYASDQSSQIELTQSQLTRRPMGRARPSGPRTAARTPTSGSTSGTTAAHSSGSTSATPAAGSSSEARTPGPLPAGTKLKLTAAGTTITFCRTGQPHHRHRHQPHRRLARDHDLRPGHRPTTGAAGSRTGGAGTPAFRSPTRAPTRTASRRTTSSPPTTATAARC